MSSKTESYEVFEIDKAFKLLLLNSHFGEFSREEIRMLTGTLMTEMETTLKNVRKGHKQ